MRSHLRTSLGLAVLLAGPMLSGGTVVGAEQSTTDSANACQLQISGNDLMQYDKKELKVPASCKEVQVTLTHGGKLPAQSMGHNWVLLRAADLNAVASAGISAGLKNNYVPVGDKRVLAHTQVVGGGQSSSVTFPASLLKQGESYMYVCTFPGHSAIMKGTISIG
jgi:azurin